MSFQNIYKGHNSQNGITPRKIQGLNYIGLQTLIHKEVGRFMNVYAQTILAPVITTLLFYAVFALAFGGTTRTIGELPYLEFLAPGLIIMTMVQNAFANTSSSMVIAKVAGNIVDVLMPPLSSLEMLLGFVIGGVIRGLAVGITVTVVIYFFVTLHFHSFFHIIVFAVLGNLLLATIGLAAGIWSQKFDHIATVTNFFITPLTFLSGTFYSIGQLPEFWEKIALFNPFFYMIDGFRYGFIGHADGSITLGLYSLGAATLAMLVLTYFMLKSGYKMKS